MKINKAEFIKSSDCLKNCPETILPEIALIGRSNVGKSSFINCLCGRKQLAKTSNTPGKTRLLNYYNIEDTFYFVDLPGYGYARISKREQEQWKKNLEAYLLQRENLRAVVQLIDARHDVQNNDFLMREWLDFNNFEIITVATKIDNLKQTEKSKSISNISKKLGVDVIPFSSKTGIGKLEILKLLDKFV